MPESPDKGRGCVYADTLLVEKSERCAQRERFSSAREAQVVELAAPPLLVNVVGDPVQRAHGLSSTGAFINNSFFHGLL